MKVTSCQLGLLCEQSDGKSFNSSTRTRLDPVGPARNLFSVHEIGEGGLQARLGKPVRMVRQDMVVSPNFESARTDDAFRLWQI